MVGITQFPLRRRARHHRPAKSFFVSGQSLTSQFQFRHLRQLGSGFSAAPSRPISFPDHRHDPIADGPRSSEVSLQVSGSNPDIGTAHFPCFPLTTIVLTGVYAVSVSPFIYRLI